MCNATDLVNDVWGLGSGLDCSSKENLEAQE